MTKITVKFMVLDPIAQNQLKSDSRSYESPAGTDLYTIEPISLSPLLHTSVRTGLALEIPQGFYGRIADKSGLALKSGVTVLGGVIDSDYRGEVSVIIMNLGTQILTLEPGSRIAQIIFESYAIPEFIQVDELSKTQRAKGAFGSTT